VKLLRRSYDEKMHSTSCNQTYAHSIRHSLLYVLPSLPHTGIMIRGHAHTGVLHSPSLALVAPLYFFKSKCIICWVTFSIIK